jgi:uncharacterized protein YggE
MQKKPSLGAFLLILGLVAGIPARTALADQVRTILVSGSGEVTANPDTAEVTFAIETHARTAADATARNAALAQKISDALKAKLGGKGTVSTSGYSLTPEYEQHQGIQNQSKITGYSAENSISVQTPAMNVLGELIDAGMGAGANRVNSLVFSLKNDTKARAEALAAASRDAQTQAQALASSLNVKLKLLMTASTEAAPRPQPLQRNMAYAMAAGAGPRTPIEPGQITISATVFLTYEIE